MPFEFHFGSAGTYYIEDDGTRGNGVSVIRDSNGILITPFTHPGDTVTFIADVPGVNLVFNTADSFGTANVTVGSLTDQTQCPDFIVVKNLQTDAFVTLAAQASITEGGSDAAADIRAAGVLLKGVSGIGTPANAIETQVTFVEAGTSFGGINLANFGSVQIGGLTSDLFGLYVVDGGDIRFSTTGFILLADSTLSSSVHGGDVSGDVILTAIGADSDILTNINQKAISAAGGGIILNAGRDVLLGTTGANFDNDLLATRSIAIHAGRDFVLDGNSDLKTSAFGGVVGGDISIEAGRNINLGNATGGLETISAFLGDVVLSTGPGGAFIEDAAIPGAVQTNEDIFLNADNVTINSGGLNNTGTGSVTIRPITPGRAIDIGTALDGPAALGLSDDEFDLLFTLHAIVGDANSGPVQFTAPLTPFIIDDIVVHSGTDILVNSSISLPRSLTLHAGDDISFSTASSFSSTNGGLLAFVDEAQDDGGDGGHGTLGGTFTTSTGLRLTGNVDNDFLNGSAVADTLQGAGGSDILGGLGGNDMLDGGTGVDRMVGGLGDDSYFADTALENIVELAGEGRDKVYAVVTFTLGANIEDLTLQAPAGAANGTGNGENNVITGNESGNTLSGLDGVDTLIGNGGNDILSGGLANDLLFGGASNDVMDGGGGADDMTGGIGDDTYFADTSLDDAIELAGQGRDKVYSNSSFTLDANVEDLTLQAVAGAASGTGNDIANVINGNDSVNTLSGLGDIDTLMGHGGNDTLLGGLGDDLLFGGDGNDMIDGGGGADDMTGGVGDDTYFADSSLDEAIELAGQGRDKVYANASFTLGANVDDLTLQAAAGGATGTGNGDNNVIAGNASANTLSGLGGADALIGNAGTDTLNGGFGNDTLEGGTEADNYFFTTALGGNVDTLIGFVGGLDKIVLENSVFAGLANGALPAGAFNTGSAASQADDRIIYNTATGALLFDADGVGGVAAVQFATLQGAPAIGAGDFTVT